MTNEKLTIKEIFTEGKLLSKITNRQKQMYKQMTNDEKRKILNDFKNGNQLDIQLYKSKNFKKDDESNRTIKSLNNQGINDPTDVTINSFEKQKIMPNLQKLYNGLGSFTTNTEKQAKFVFYDTELKQNYIFTAQNDKIIKQNDKLVEQNNEIINLLRQIVDK